MLANNLNRNFMYLSSTEAGLTSNPLRIPTPALDKGNFETATNVDAGRNTNGVVVGQVVGRPVDKQNMTWAALPNEVWWEMNAFWDENHTFWCKYFSYNRGVWKTRKFYCGNRSAEPYKRDPSTGLPELMRNCSCNVIDTGEGD